MISDKDRRFYIGGSDAYKVLGNHDTNTYEKWWFEKLGMREHEDHENIYTLAGTRYEHPILEAYGNKIGIEINMDRQLIIEDKMLRINYDGDWNGTIFEVKTHKIDPVKPWDYKQKYIYYQCQVQMYVWKQMMPEFDKLYVLEYPLYEEELRNESPTVEDIDKRRIKRHKISYDEGVVNKFLDKLEPMLPLLKEAKEKEELRGGFGGKEEQKK